ncbi:hypothetical protein [Jiella flava]|uniref:Uncharacterized protein n=1 Tax=Jiella flava TaxID=2816857 RepID=A0A939JUI8_9HYPH|nr:hypothetical protein [Jiella flava]MBO0660997.1 hypothetical protein [Jiella flava]
MILYGNSHVECVARAGVTWPDFSIARICSIREEEDELSGKQMTGSFIERSRNFSRSVKIFTSYLGTYHNIIGLLNHNIPFSLLDGFDDLDLNNVEIVPESVMEEVISDYWKSKSFLPRLRESTNCEIYHLMSPPPKQDLQRFASKAKRYRGQAIADYGYAPAKHRLALWKLEKAFIDQYLNSLGVTSLGPPADAATPEGYLKPEFCAYDAQHGNEAYGALVARQIHQVAEAEEPLTVSR